jgi:hypothetical protein
MAQHEHDPFSPHDSVSDRKRRRKAPTATQDEAGADEATEDDEE